MDIWVKVIRVKGRTYRHGDVAGVYPLAEGETLPDMSLLTGKDGRHPFAALGIRNLPARITTIEQAKEFFHQPWEDEPANPEDPREEPPDNAERDGEGNITRPAFMPRRKFRISRQRLSPARRHALFRDPPFNLTITWAQLRPALRQHKANRAVNDNDLPAARP